MHCTLGWVKSDNPYWRPCQLNQWVRGFQPPNMRPIALAIESALLNFYCRVLLPGFTPGFWLLMLIIVFDHISSGKATSSCLSRRILCLNTNPDPSNPTEIKTREWNPGEKPGVKSWEVRSHNDRKWRPYQYCKESPFMIPLELNSQNMLHCLDFKCPIYGTHLTAS